MTRTYESPYLAEDAIKRYFCNRAMANGLKRTPTIKSGDYDFRDGFFFKKFTAGRFEATMVVVNNHTVQVKTEY